ncbi:MAG: cystathionine beta-synthase [Planctomycetes bacterium]|nr:cystathionine beta-synthase [Planctomycetota bacterium]
MEIHEDILQTVGHTPLVRLNRIARGIQAQVVAKLEYFNPGSSVKDRIGLPMIEDAERRGLLKPGGTIVENTSGNTGLGLAIAAAVKGYRCVFTMPDKMSFEKVNLLKAFGAEVIVTPTAVAPDDPRSYYSVARRLSQEIPNAYYPNQYSNPANPQAHYESTGPEVWRQTDGRVTHFVSSVGTGGTITGTARYLKERNPEVRVVGVDPVGSIYYDLFHTGQVPPGALKTYKVEGFGEDFLPETVDLKLIDEMVQVTDRECFHMARRLARSEGIFAGGSSGAAVHAALKVARDLPAEALVVVLLPDTGERYLSKVFNDEWLRENQLLETRYSLGVREILARKGAAGRGLVSVRPGATVAEAIALMQRHDVSQLPVLDGEDQVGTFREERVIDCLLGGRDTAALRVRDHMDAPLPVVEEDADLESISRMLTRETPAVIVRCDQGLEILTKYDLVQALASRQDGGGAR